MRRLLSFDRPNEMHQSVLLDTLVIMHGENMPREGDLRVGVVRPCGDGVVVVPGLTLGEVKGWSPRKSAGVRGHGDMGLVGTLLVECS